MTIGKLRYIQYMRARPNDLIERNLHPWADNGLFQIISIVSQSRTRWLLGSMQ